MSSQSPQPAAHTTSPAWLTALREAGYLPYILTSKRLLPAMNTRPFGVELAHFFMEDASHLSFQEAYFLSNALAFKAPDLKMPSWVLIDSVMMQSAVVGFMRAKHALPDTLLDYYHNDPHVNLDELDYLPVTGQISSPTLGGDDMVGISLFSLGREMEGPKNLGLFTKALALEVYKATSYAKYHGVAQYHNPALRIHGRFTTEMEIYQPMLPLHPLKDMTLVYKMQLDYDPYTIETELPAQTPTFWLNAKDKAAKREIEAGIATGKRYIIAPPFSVRQGDDVMLPIIVKG